MSIKIYLSGPMRGIPEFNFPAFHAAAKKLRDEGYQVYNPAEKDEETYGDNMSKDNPTGDEERAKAEYNFDLRKALAKDLAYICRYADAIAMLPGWENSKGARAEYAAAIAIGLEVIILCGEKIYLGITPSCKVPKLNGEKFDEGKSPVFKGLLAYFPRACLEVAKVSERGAEKYSWNGWETVPNGEERYLNAMGRHIALLSIQGDIDEETGLEHRAQVAWNALAALELYLRRKE